MITPSSACPDVVDFLEQAVRDVGDKVPTVTDVLDQPFLPQPLQRAFDVQAADAVLCRQRDLAQPVPRGKIAVQDRFFSSSYNACASMRIQPAFYIKIVILYQ